MTGDEIVLFHDYWFILSKKNKQKEGNARKKGLPRNCELQNTSWRTKKYGQVISPNVVFGVSQFQGGQIGSLWMDST